MYRGFDFTMERDVNQLIWNSMMGELGMNSDLEYENDTFKVKAYDWGDYDELDEDAEDPNEWHFWHKPSGLKVAWYKYPLRGCGWNMSGLSHEFFYEVLKDCRNSMNRDKGTNVTYDCYKWWEGVNERS